jgi:hypothetical protein
MHALNAWSHWVFWPTKSSVTTTFIHVYQSLRMCMYLLFTLQLLWMCLISVHVACACKCAHFQHVCFFIHLWWECSIGYVLFVPHAQTLFHIFFILYACALHASKS